MTESRLVSLPQSLCAEAERQFKSQFDSVEALLVFILQEVTKADATQLDQHEIQMIEQRLRDLGYL